MPDPTPIPQQGPYVAGGVPGQGSGQTHAPPGTHYDHIVGDVTYHMIADGHGSGVVDPNRPPERLATQKPATDKTPVPVRDKQGNIVGYWDPDNPTAVSSVESPVQMPVQDVWSMHQDPNTGAYYTHNARTNETKWVRGTDGMPETNPMVIAQHQTAIDQANESIRASQSRTGLDTAIYNRDTTRQQAQDDLALQQQAFTQGQTALGNRMQVGYTIPRQAQIDANQARQYQGQEAAQRMTGAINRETLGQTAGNNAVERAQWAAERMIGPEGVAAMRGAAGGAPVSPASFVTPMPRFEDIFGQARGQAVNQVPSYQQAVDQTPGYGVFQPPYDRYQDELQYYISPYNAIFGGR